LSDKRQAVKHKSHDASQDKRDYDNDKAPSANFKFFSGQTMRGVLVGQLTSPKQGLQGNQGNLV
jgi:hypothetical protein